MTRGHSTRWTSGSTTCTEWLLGGVRTRSQRGDRTGRFLVRAGEAEGLTCRSYALGFDDSVAAVQRVALNPMANVKPAEHLPVVLQMAHETPDEQQRPDQTDTKTDRQHDHRDP